MAYTAAAMYGGAALDELVTGYLPGDPRIDLPTTLLAAAVVAGLVLLGPRLPAAALAALGPIGVVLIAQALAGAPHAGDAAVLYLWPVVWSSFFFGRRGAAGILACIAVAHAVVLATLAGGAGYPGRWLEVMISSIGVAVVVVRLAERNEALLSRIAHEARVDALTGLLNRRGFEERAALEIARARSSREPIALATCDIDRFKDINDRHGHETGDRVLVHVADVLRSQTREIDVVARIGGDEFVALLPGADPGRARAVAARVREALSRVPPGLPPAQVSIGIDVACEPGSEREMRVRADRALYAAKRAGRDRAFQSPAPEPAGEYALRALAAPMSCSRALDVDAGG